MTCTCAGTAPGYPQHEDHCGQPEDDCRPGCVYGLGGHDGDCLDAEDIAEERLRSRDYDAWASL